MLYTFVRFWLQVYFRIYFGKVQVFGQEKLPKNAGILFSPNHQNALIDPLILAVTLKKPIYFFTRGDVFIKPLNRILKRLNLLPVYRIRDGFSSLKKNQNAFDIGIQKLLERNNVLMFSEGLHHEEYFLHPISKGSSRLMLQAQQGAPDPMYMVPVGINYSAPKEAGSHIHLVFGDPIQVPSVPLGQSIQPQTIRELKNKLEVGMQSCLWIPKFSDQYQRQVARINHLITKKSFVEVRKHLHGEEQAPLPNRMIVRWIKKGIGFANYLPAAFIRWQCKRLKDPVFEGMLRCFASLFVYPFYWFILAIFSSFFVSFQQLVWLVAICILLKSIENKI